MTPPKPPLPTASNVPFQPEIGIHTSILMSESLDGDRVAVTRQKAGRVANWVNAGCPPIPEPPNVGGVKVPGSTVFADAIVVLGNLIEARLSQDAARTGNAVKVKIA